MLIQPSTVQGIYMEPWNPEYHDNSLWKFDNSKLVAINTCPTYGLLRYQHHKVFTSNRRNMALEAGLACHEAFAGCRLADLYMNGTQWYPEIDVMDTARKHMKRLFGAARTQQWEDELRRGEDTERSIMLATLCMFDTSGFYDDDYDKRRTRANIEEALIVYVSKYPLSKIMCVVREGFVGVEIGVDMYLRIDMVDGPPHEYHFTGRVDSVTYTDKRKEVIRVEDNKTAARLDEAWRLSWAISHQPTGYCLAASSLLGQPVATGVIRGLAIPIPKTYDYGGVVVEPIRRSTQQFTEWAEWVIYTEAIAKPYLNTPLNAPKFTHSCNRYFHPCTYIPFCDSDYADRADMFEQMDLSEWNPVTEHFEDEQ